MKLYNDGSYLRTKLYNDGDYLLPVTKEEITQYTDREEGRIMTATIEKVLRGIDEWSGKVRRVRLTLDVDGDVVRVEIDMANENEAEAREEQEDDKSS